MQNKCDFLFKKLCSCLTLYNTLIQSTSYRAKKNPIHHSIWCVCVFRNMHTSAQVFLTKYPDNFISIVVPMVFLRVPCQQISSTVNCGHCEFMSSRGSKQPNTSQMNETKPQSFNRKIKRKKIGAPPFHQMPFTVLCFLLPMCCCFVGKRPSNTGAAFFLSLQTHKQYILNVCNAYVPDLKHQTLTNYFVCVTTHSTIFVLRMNRICICTIFYW